MSSSSPNAPAPSMATGRSRCPTRPVMNDERMEPLRRAPDRLAELLHEDGFQLVYHHHMGTVVQTGEEIDRLMDDTGRAGASAARHRPRDLGRRRSGRARQDLRARISHVHCKDVRPAVRAEADDEGLVLPR